jgi:hypothetical protein
VVSASIVTAVVGLFSGLFGGVLARPLQERLFYRPNLAVNFDPDDRRCIADADMSEHRWARVSIRNDGKIHLGQCQALVTDIKQEQAHNPDQWENTDPHFIEPLILEWASMPDSIKFQPQQIPVGIEFFGNVLY